MKLGRRDSRGASISKANKELPTPTSSLSTITSKFAHQGLSLKDMIALSGNFTLPLSQGSAHKNTLFNYIYTLPLQIVLIIFWKKKIPKCPSPPNTHTYTHTPINERVVSVDNFKEMWKFSYFCNKMPKKFVIWSLN